MNEIHTWISVDDYTVRCPHCGAKLPRPNKDNKSLTITCTRCNKLIYNEDILFEQLAAYMEGMYDNTNALYDESVEAVKFFLRRYAYLKELATVLENSFQQISEEVLGKDYYIVDPVDGITAVQVMTNDIMKTLQRTERRKKWFKRGIRK